MCVCLQYFSVDCADKQQTGIKHIPIINPGSIDQIMQNNTEEIRKKMIIGKKTRIKLERFDVFYAMVEILTINIFEQC